MALTVNGKSTLYEQEGDPSHLLAWVIEPGREYAIDGFQIDKNTRKPFRVLSDAENADFTFGPNTGLIHFHIFKSGGAGGTKDIAGGDGGAKDDPSAQAMNISLRGLNRATLVRTGKTRSLSELKKTVQDHAHVGRRITQRFRRGRIVRSTVRFRMTRSQTPSWCRRLWCGITSETGNDLPLLARRDRGRYWLPVWRGATVRPARSLMSQIMSNTDRSRGFHLRSRIRPTLILSVALLSAGTPVRSRTLRNCVSCTLSSSSTR